MLDFVTNILSHDEDLFTFVRGEIYWVRGSFLIIIILVNLISTYQVSEEESPIVDINGARPHVLMLEKDPDAHLPLIVLIAYVVEILIHDLVQVLLLHGLQLL